MMSEALEPTEQSEPVESVEAKLTRFQGFEFVRVHRNQIKNAPYNPRLIKKTNRNRLKHSIKKHKLVDTFVWNARTGNIVGGHQRMSQLDELEGNDNYLIDVHKIDVDEETEKAINIALNNRTMQGDWDLSMLEGVVEDLLSSGTPMEDAGYTTTDLQHLFPDRFLFGDVATQYDAESEAIADLSDIKRAGAEYESGFRDAAGLPPKNNRSNSNMPSMEGIDGAEDYDPSNENPTLQGNEAFSQSSGDGPPSVATQSQSANEPNWQHNKQYFKDGRQRTVDNNAEVAAATDVLVTLTFQTNEQLKSFLEQFGLEDKRYFDIHDIETSFGITLPR